MRNFRILAVALATVTITMVAGEPQLFNFQLGSNPDETDSDVVYGSAAPELDSKYKSKSPSTSSFLSNAPGPLNYDSSSQSSDRSPGPLNYQSGPSESEYGSSSSEADYQSESPANSLYQSEGVSGVSGYRSRPSGSSGYQSGPPGSSAFEISDTPEGYQSGGPSSYRGVSLASSGGYRPGPPPGYSRKPHGPSYSLGHPGGDFESSPPSYSSGGFSGAGSYRGPRGPPGPSGYLRSSSESFPQRFSRISRGIMGLFTSASSPQLLIQPANFFSPPHRPRGPMFTAASKSTGFYLEPPTKDAPSFYGVRSPFKFGARNKSPFSLLTSETNNQIQPEFIPFPSQGGRRPFQNPQQIISQAAQTQHAKIVEKENPNGKFTFSHNAPTQFQSEGQEQDYMNPYPTINGPSIFDQQLVMSNGPEGNPVFLQQQQQPQSAPQSPQGFQFAPQQFALSSPPLGPPQPQYSIMSGPPPPHQQFSLAGPPPQFSFGGPPPLQQPQFSFAPQSQQFTLAPQPQQHQIISRPHPHQVQTQSQKQKSQPQVQYVSAPGSNEQNQGPLTLASRPGVPFPSLTVTHPTQFNQQGPPQQQLISSMAPPPNGFTITNAQSIYPQGQQGFIIQNQNQAQQDAQFQQLLFNNQLDQSQLQLQQPQIQLIQQNSQQQIQNQQPLLQQIQQQHQQQIQLQQQQQQQNQQQKPQQVISKQSLTQGQYQNLIQQAISQDNTNVEPSRPQAQEQNQQQQLVKPSTPQGPSIISSSPSQLFEHMQGAFSTDDAQIALIEPEEAS